MTPVLSLPSFTGNRNNTDIFLYNWRALYTPTFQTDCNRQTDRQTQSHLISRSAKFTRSRWPVNSLTVCHQPSNNGRVFYMNVHIHRIAVTWFLLSISMPAVLQPRCGPSKPPEMFVAAAAVAISLFSNLVIILTDLIWFKRRILIFATPSFKQHTVLPHAQQRS